MNTRDEWISINDAAYEIGGSAIRPEYLLDLCRKENFPVKGGHKQRPPMIKRSTVDFIKAKMNG